MEVWNCKCCFKSHFSSIGQINERTSRPMCSDVSLFIGALRGIKVHRWICHHAWADSPLNCPEPVSDNSPVNCRTITEIGCHHIWIRIHRWIVGPSQSPRLGRFTAELSWACVRQFTGELSDHHWNWLSPHMNSNSPLNCRTITITTLGQIHRWIVLSLCPTIHRWTFASWPAMRQLVGRFVLSA